jgi:hypothetical protein
VLRGNSDGLQGIHVDSPTLTIFFPHSPGVAVIQTQ